jgi:hypothetical protein
MTSLLLSNTSPCIIVFLVSGANTTPPPLIPLAAAAPVGSLIELDEAEAEVEAVGVEERSRPDKMEGKLEVKLGYKCATCSVVSLQTREFTSR